MLNLLNRPVKRRSRPGKKFNGRNYRKALKYLLNDFEGRCAYSLYHVVHMSKSVMEVDHFNPKLKGNIKHCYGNLMPAYRHCNSRKSNNWPTRAQQKKGIRFLNPRKEIDYGVHIFEDPRNQKVWGSTPAESSRHRARIPLSKSDPDNPRRPHQAGKVKKAGLISAEESNFLTKRQ